MNLPERIEVQLKRQHRRRIRLINHALVFTALNLGIWLHYLSFTRFQPNALIDRLVVTLVWSLLLIMHYINYRQGNALDRLLRLQTRKPKREGEAVYLDDDGELVYLEEDMARRQRS